MYNARQEPSQTFDGYDTPIEDLDLSVRAYNCLKRSGLVTVGAILERSEEELMALRNFGEKSYEELRDKLVSRGFPAPRVDSRRQAVPTGVSAGGGQPGQADTGDSRDTEDVGSLGAALIQALREAGEDPSELVEDDQE
jgi:DNA-directed RNA polymerase subunit alpha